MHRCIPAQITWKAMQTSRQYVTAFKPEWCHTWKNPRTNHEAHLVGIAYNKTTNGDHLFNLLRQLSENKDSQVVTLMESYNCPTEDVINSGDKIPYRECLSPLGLQRAMVGMKSEEFRQVLSGEMVAVLQSLCLDIDVVFCDRSHWLSVDRIVSRYTIQELEERVANALNRTVAEAKRRGVPVVLVQNTLLPVFPELLQERQLVMVHHARQATERGSAVVVVGGQHVEGLASLWDTPADISELLNVQPTPTDSLEVTLQKRALLLALFMTTSAFPADAVTTSLPELDDEQTEAFRQRYNFYRTALQRRMIDTATGKEDMMRFMRQGMDARGLPQLLRLLEELEALETATIEATE